MPKQEKITPLQEKFDALSKIDSAIFLKRVQDHFGIATFYRDLKKSAKNIEHFRLQVYAALLDCEVDDLLDSFVKIKPIVRKNLSRKSGLKTN